MKEMQKVLVVDDEPMILQSMEDLLEDDFQVLTCGSGEAALNLLEQNEFAVVLSDQRMPGLTGAQLLSMVKEVSQASRLLITGYTDIEDLSRAVNTAQIYAYIPKPWNPAELKLLVSRAAEHFKLEREVAWERGLTNTLLENIPDTIYFKDRQSRFTRVNRAQARFLGLRDPSESTGKTDSDYLDADYARAALADELKIIETGQPLVEKTEELKNGGGVSRWISTTKVAIRGPEGEVTGTVGISRDITALKRIEESLRASDERFRELANSIDDVFWITSPQCTEVIYVSPAYEKIWGRSCDSLYAEPLMWVEAIHPEDRPAVFSAIGKMVLGEFNEEYRIIKPDGSIRWIWDRAFPIEDEYGHIYRIAGVAEDITERKKDRESLHQAKQAAETANRVKSEFLAGMSHEIRTPMNAMLGIAELLAETPLTGEQQDYVQVFQKAGGRLLRLIDDILNLSKVEAGRVELDNRPFDLAAVLQQTTGMMTKIALEKGLGLSYSIDPNVPQCLVGDADRLQQILLNLIGNALKFTHSGAITMHVRRDPEDTEPGRLHFAVSDTGIGVPPNKVKMIFDKFSQADSSTTREFGGTGLGLAICRSLVSLMQGRIWVESKPGSGSTFFFTAQFTILSEAERREVEEGERRLALAAALPAYRKEEAGPARRILLVDDSPDNMFLIRAYLKNSSHVVDEAANGEIAVHRFISARKKPRPENYDLVLMDIQMPVMDGYAATERIRAWERENGVQPTPILALTAHALAEDLEKSLNAGCSGHLTKPIGKAGLLRAIWEHTETILPPLVYSVPEGFEDIAPEFLEGRRTDIQKLLAALHEKDFEPVRILGHNMKGTGTSYGFPDITEIGGLLELAAKSSNAAEASKQVSALSVYLSRVQADMSARVAE